MANGTLEQIVKLSIQNRRPDLYRLLMKVGAKFRGFTEIEIKRVKRNQGLYPREATDFDRVEIYAEALKEGAVFPPILISEEDNLVDGNHRTESHIRADHERIWAERWEIPPHYLKLIAQAANTEAGKIDTPLTGKEKRRAIIQDWEDGIRDVELIAEALKTSPSYVRKVLSQAGLIKDRKEQMKERARKLREEGLSYRQIAEKLEKEFGEKLDRSTIIKWFQGGEKITQVRNSPPVSAGSSKSEEEQPEIQSKGTEDYAKYKDTAIPLATIEYWIGECRSYVETGTPPEEAVEIVGVPEDNDVRKYVVEELKERFWNKKEEEEKKKEEEIQKWVEACKSYIDAGFEPKEAAERAGVPEEIRVPVVKKLVGYKNHLYQEEEARFKAELGPVDSRRRDIILKAYRLTSLIQEIEHKLKELDRVLEASEDEADQQMFRFYGRDHYIRNYLMFILVRGGWEKAEWFREITRLYLKFLIHPSEIDEFLEEMKEAAKKTPEQYEEEAKKFWEEHLASEAELKWKKFCEALGLPVLKEHGGDV